jgi:outer membrane immunogenic protein
VNAGVGFGTFKTDFNVAPSNLEDSLVTSVPLFAAIPGFAGRDEVYPGGFIGGGQIGFNWQFSPMWVVGLEADFQGADEKEHSTLTQNFSAPFLFANGAPAPAGVFGTTALDYAAKIEWFGTARLRAGYLFGDGAVFSYVTGGLAYGKVDVEGTSTLTVAPHPGFPLPQAFDHSNVNTGWVVGSGTEGKLLIPGWTYKIEGLYMDLGHLDARGPGGSFTAPGIAVTGGQVTTHTHFTDTILRLGVNYQFH